MKKFQLAMVSVGFALFMAVFSAQAFACGEVEERLETEGETPVVASEPSSDSSSDSSAGDSAASAR
jgi:hypothetical protein